MPILSITLFLPLIGALVILFAARGEGSDAKAKGLALLFSGLTFLVSLAILCGFDSANPDIQMAERYEWIAGWGISYFLGVDGLTVLLVMLTTLLTPLVILAGFSNVEKRLPGYMAAMLALETGMLGAFFALDLFLFYVFWEAMLIPMYLLIGIWGGEQRIYAAVKFFLYTMFGSVLMLLSIAALVYMHFEQTGTVTFSLLDLLNTPMHYEVQLWCFAAFALAFAIKVPLFPLHTWLPDAHVQAPTGGSVILAGVLLKMGTYGLVRFAMPLFPAAAVAFAPWLGSLAVVGIIYGALVAMVQPDVKKLVAYSSVSHLGFVVLGISALTPEAFEGAMLQMLNHGVSTGLLFLMVGIIYERRHTRLISEYGGLARVVPVFATLLMIVTFSSIGLPGLNGFVGEFLILLGTFNANNHYGTFHAAFAATGVILSAIYMLWMIQRVLWGPLTNPKNERLADVKPRELAYLAPLLALVFIMGLVPGPFLKTYHASTEAFLGRFEDNAVMASLPAEDAGGRAALAELLADRSNDEAGSELALAEHE